MEVAAGNEEDKPMEPVQEELSPRRKNNSKRNVGRINGGPQSKQMDRKTVIEDGHARSSDVRHPDEEARREDITMEDKVHVGSDVRVGSPTRNPATKRRDDGEEAGRQDKRLRVDDVDSADNTVDSDKCSDSSQQGITDSDGRLWEERRQRDGKYVSHL